MVLNQGLVGVPKFTGGTVGVPWRLLSASDLDPIVANCCEIIAYKPILRFVRLFTNPATTQGRSPSGWVCEPIQTDFYGL